MDREIEKEIEKGGHRVENQFLNNSIPVGVPVAFSLVRGNKNKIKKNAMHCIEEEFYCESG